MVKVIWQNRYGHSQPHITDVKWWMTKAAAGCGHMRHPRTTSESKAAEAWTLEAKLEGWSVGRAASRNYANLPNAYDDVFQTKLETKSWKALEGRAHKQWQRRPLQQLLRQEFTEVYDNGMGYE